jgi:hypothetical protein
MGQIGWHVSYCSQWDGVSSLLDRCGCRFVHRARRLCVERHVECTEAAGTEISARKRWCGSDTARRHRHPVIKGAPTATCTDHARLQRPAYSLLLPVFQIVCHGHCFVDLALPFCSTSYNTPFSPPKSSCSLYRYNSPVMRCLTFRQSPFSTLKRPRGSRRNANSSSPTRGST